MPDTETVVHSPTPPSSSSSSSSWEKALASCIDQASCAVHAERMRQAASLRRARAVQRSRRPVFLPFGRRARLVTSGMAGSPARDTGIALAPAPASIEGYLIAPVAPCSTPPRAEAPQSPMRINFGNTQGAGVLAWRGSGGGVGEISRPGQRVERIRRLVGVLIRFRG